jgi:hypothetical protein
MESPKVKRGGQKPPPENKEPIKTRKVRKPRNKEPLTPTPIKNPEINRGQKLFTLK